jgi:lysophospholipase L1-like esterase
VRNVVCIGDSITYDRAMLRTGITRNWVEQLATALDDLTGARPGDGFRGLWRDEWKQHGVWTQIAASDAFDVAPFRQGYFSSGHTDDRVVWTKPASMTAAAFDLYWVQVPGIGDWQYRVDDDAWQNVGAPPGAADNKLHRSFVNQHVQRRVQVRGHDGNRPCVASIVGINPYAMSPPAPTATLVHNLGHQHQLFAAFCRPSAGDPLALLDDLRPDLITVLFTNDVRLHDPKRFGRTLRDLVERVASYADVLLISPYEQRPPRRVGDAATASGSDVVTSPSALFLASDSGTLIRGTNIPNGARIASVQSTRIATITAAATSSCANGELTIEGRRDAMLQAEYRAITKHIAASAGCALVDLYDAWAETAGTGWDAGYAGGLMQDGLHPTQLGHDLIAARVQDALGLSGA